MTPKLSVIMPTWNRADKIVHALASIHNQELRDIELCVVDDGSTDNTEEVVRLFLSTTPIRFDLKYKRLEKVGISRARNAGLVMASAPLIAYLDTDNIWTSECASTIIETFETQPDIESAYSRMQFVHADGFEQSILFCPFDRAALLYQNFIDMNVFAHRRECVDKYGMFDFSLRRLVDWDLVIRYTRERPPFEIAHTLCNYLVDETTNRISVIESMRVAMRSVIEKHLKEIVERDIDGLVLKGHPQRHATLVQPTWDQYYREILSELEAQRNSVRKQLSR